MLVDYLVRFTNSFVFKELFVLVSLFGDDNEVVCYKGVLPLDDPCDRRSCTPLGYMPRFSFLQITKSLCVWGDAVRDACARVRVLMQKELGFANPGGV